MRKFLTGVVIVLVLVSVATVAFASFTDVTIQVSFRNIKIIKNGTEIKPELEPFIYNGHVYVGIKDIARMFSVPIRWDSEKDAVILGTEERDTYTLSEIPFLEEKLEEQPDGSFKNVGSSYNEVLSGIRFATINGKVFKDALLFGGAEAEYFKFPLNGKFESFSFIAGATDNSIATSDNDYVTIKIYGDSNLLYTSPPLRPNGGAVFVKIPVENVNILTIEKHINGDSVINAALVNTELRLNKTQ